MKQKITQKAKEMFFRVGYSKVTLSEISSEMGISKKTIYNHFNGKEDLLYAVMDVAKKQFEAEMEKIQQNEALEFREMVTEILSVLGIWVSQLSTFAKDLTRHHPDAYRYMTKIKQDVITRHAMHIMKKGKELGRLNDNNESSVALFMFLASAEKVTDEGYRDALPEELIKNFPASPTEMFKTILKIIYQGIKK